MDLDQALPRELKTADTPSLARLEEQALVLDLSRRLPPSWVAANAAADGTHYLWPALWNNLSHRPDLPSPLRCELLIALRTGERVVSLLDVLLDDFTSLPRVTSRDEGVEVRRLLDSALSVDEWLSREGETRF
ncbi:hypothetical protein ACWDWV_25690 [Streptosporangium sandarakinum]